MRVALTLASMIAFGSTALAFGEDFSKVHNGMEKDRVIEAVGGPTFSERVSGQDWWTYEERHRGVDEVVVHEVHFQDGKVVYVGPHQKPKITPEEKDRRNEESNLAEEARLKVEDEAHDKLLGIKRGSAAPEDAADRRLRESMYGLDPDPQAEKHTYAPTFEPVR